MKTPLNLPKISIPQLKRIYTSFDDVTKAYNHVRDELIRFGVLWRGSRLDGVQCIYEPVALKSALRGWMGYFDFDDHQIHFPSLYLPIGWLVGRVGAKDGPRNVIRHEFGHALADRYPEMLKKSGVFYKAFRGTYGPAPARGTDPKNWEGRCVSGYAATATQEDFAETFMLFVKYKGELPARFEEKPAIKKKWDAVAEICHRVAAESR